jgi:hypothetical protein
MANTPAAPTNTLGVDNDRWQSGLTIEAFVDGAEAYQEELRRRLRTVRLRDDERAPFTWLTAPAYALALAEGGSLDSLMNLPILARVVEAAPGLELRVFVRGRSPKLAAAYQARGVAGDPVFSVFDAAFREVGTWAGPPRPAQAHHALWEAEHPELAAVRADPNLSEAQRRAILRPLYAGLLPQLECWYAAEFQAAAVAELRGLLAPLI